MDESTDGDNAADGLEVLELLKKKADEVFSTFELLPGHLQMDGLDILQGIVTKTVRKITMGKVSSVKFVPVQEKNKSATPPPPPQQENSTPSPEIKQEPKSDAEPEYFHPDVVHNADETPGSIEIATPQAISTETPPEPTFPATPPAASGIETTVTPANMVSEFDKNGKEGEQQEVGCPRSTERLAARTAALRIKEEVLSDDESQLSAEATNEGPDSDQDFQDSGEETDEVSKDVPTLRTRRGKKSHKGSKVFTCRYCTYSCESRSELRAHQESIHTGSRMYECECCTKKFSAVSSLKRHRLTHTGEKPHECPVCGKRFYQESQLRVHSVVHTGERMYACTECTKCYTNSANLRRHYRIHTGEMPYTCKDCDARFRDFSSLKLHKLKHTGEKPYTCEVCNKQFKTSSDFRRHERTHTGERKYECPDCGKMFIQGWHLVQHSRIHNNERAWSCDRCGKRFRTKASLQFHTRSHLGIKNYTCATCKKSFSTKKYLQSHQVVHTLAKPYRCSTCGARFNQYPNMKRHERIHSEEKRYKCKVCGKEFKYINSLQYHEGIHRGERMMCEKCGLGFRSKSGLQHHRCDPWNYTENVKKMVSMQRPVVRLESLDLRMLSADGTVSVAGQNKPSKLEAQAENSHPRIVLKIPKKKLKVKMFNVSRVTAAMESDDTTNQLGNTSEKEENLLETHENETISKGRRGRSRKTKINVDGEKRVPPLRISTTSKSPVEGPVPVQLFTKIVIRDRYSQTRTYSADPKGDTSSHSDNNSACASSATLLRGSSCDELSEMTVNSTDEIIVKQEVVRDAEEGSDDVMAMVSDGQSATCNPRKDEDDTNTEHSDMELMKAAYDTC